MCNTVPDCLLEEDERYCTALTTTDYISVDSEGAPLPQHEGILLFREEGIWKPICVSALPASLASRICRYMGFNPDSHSLVSSDTLWITRLTLNTSPSRPHLGEEKSNTMPHRVLFSAWRENICHDEFYTEHKSQLLLLFKYSSLQSQRGVKFCQFCICL